MIYIDTSALVPMFIREPASDAIVDLIESTEDRLAISEWSLVEFVSAAAIKVRTGQTDANLANEAIERVRGFADTHCLVALPGREEYRRAAALAVPGPLKLRAGDALHLAIVESLNATGMLCLDKALAAAARSLGIEVRTVD